MGVSAQSICIIRCTSIFRRSSPEKKVVWKYYVVNRVAFFTSTFPNVLVQMAKTAWRVTILAEITLKISGINIFWPPWAIAVFWSHGAPQVRTSNASGDRPRYARQVHTHDGSTCFCCSSHWMFVVECVQHIFRNSILTRALDLSRKNQIFKYSY